MTVTVCDLGDPERNLDLNFWNWRTIVEAIRRLDILPADRAMKLHEPICGHKWSESEARQISSALKARLLPTLAENGRLLLDGAQTLQPDNLIFHRDAENADKNYSTNAEIVRRLSDFLDDCKGFELL